MMWSYHVGPNDGDEIYEKDTRSHLANCVTIFSEYFCSAKYFSRNIEDSLMMLNSLIYAHMINNECLEKVQPSRHIC